MIQLEIYKGSKSRHTCPSCGARNCFARYQSENGEYLASDVGRCNRESKCGYHKKPKDYFFENPNAQNPEKTGNRKKARLNCGFAQQEVITASPKRPDYIEQSYLLQTLAGYEQNAFVQFLLNLFPEDSPEVWKAIKNYFIGTSSDGKTVFWQIDQSRRIRTGKIMLYNARTGKRIAETFTNRNGETIEIKTNWIHARLKRQGKLEEDFNLKQCYFGEHLLRLETEKPVAVVEAEKTALIASICFPEFVWLATGGKQNLNVEGLKRLGLRKIILYPDSDGFGKWREIALEARGRGLDVKLSSLIEIRTESAEKANGYDLADYLINEQNEVNKFNEYADRYNAALDRVQTDKSLIRQLDTILDEQKSILVIDGGLSESAAESQICNLNNLRRTVLSLAA